MATTAGRAFAHGKLRKEPIISPNSSSYEVNSPSQRKRNIPNLTKFGSSSIPTIKNSPSNLRSMTLNKKPVPSCDSSQKPVLARRKSLDQRHSFSSSPVQKSPTSSISKDRTFRPPSFPTRATSVPLKTRQEITLPKPTKDVKKQSTSAKSKSLIAKKVITSNVDSPKKQINGRKTLTGTKSLKVGSIEMVDIAENNPKVESNTSQETQKLSMVIDADVNKEMDVELFVLDGKDQIDLLHEEFENFGGDDELKHLESFVGFPENQSELLEKMTGNDNEEVEESYSKNDIINNNPAEVISEEKSAKEDSSNEQTIEETKEESQISNPNEKEEEKVILVEKINTETRNPVAKTQVASNSHWKKETQAYNDVIEETASKLREKRKNKVLALAGAFETVISMQ